MKYIFSLGQTWSMMTDECSTRAFITRARDRHAAPFWIETTEIDIRFGNKLRQTEHRRRSSRNLGGPDGEARRKTQP